MEENIRYIKVFTPYHEYYREGYFVYDVDELGKLSFGTVVETSMGFGIIIDENVPDEKVPPKITRIKYIEQVASEKNSKAVKTQWWNIILEIHGELNKRNL